MKKPNLEEYLIDNYNKGFIDHSIRADVQTYGTVLFYIHPTNADGQTLDFQVVENRLIQR